MNNKSLIILPVMASGFAVPAMAVNEFGGSWTYYGPAMEYWGAEGSLNQQVQYGTYHHVQVGGPNDRNEYINVLNASYWYDVYAYSGAWC